MLDQLQGSVERLQRSPESTSWSKHSYTEVTLIQCARETIAKATTMYEGSLAVESVARGFGAGDSSSIRVAEWVSTLDSIRRDQASVMVSNSPPISSGDGTSTVMTCASSAPRDGQKQEAVDTIEADFEDDLNTDLAKAALETGTKAFEKKEWEEANSFLQEALQVLQHLSKQQRKFCDFFGLQYKLAICAYHIQKPTDAEEALVSLIQQPATSDEQRGYIHDAEHLLSYLYIRIGKLDRARSECEKALQARRRLLGKRSDASLESTALMGHIYTLLNNRTRAKSYLSMIPEERRDAILSTIEESVGAKVEHLDSPALLSRSISEESDLEVKSIQSRLSASSVGHPMLDRCYGPVSPRFSQAPAAGPKQPYQHVPPSIEEIGNIRSMSITSLSSAESGVESKATDRESRRENYSSISKASSVILPLSPSQPPEAQDVFKSKTLSRKEIIDKVGCPPKDRIEEVVCNGDYSALVSLLKKKKDAWRSNFRRHVRPERVTALHFAALFGEAEIARCLLDSGFNVNEVPFGYSTSLTPLKFAIGARQVDMVKFLVQNGARPSEPDTWSILAAQLMNRSWLMKTMSESENASTANRIIAILRILLEYGWNINVPFERSGKTVLHQAVTFWTGSYKWDLDVRTAVTSFLCDMGADPYQANKEGKAPYEMALASGHQELLLVLDRESKYKDFDDRPAQIFELPSRPKSPSELSGL